MIRPKRADAIENSVDANGSEFQLPSFAEKHGNKYIACNENDGYKAAFVVSLFLSFVLISFACIKYVVSLLIYDEIINYSAFHGIKSTHTTVVSIISILIGNISSHIYLVYIVILRYCLMYYKIDGLNSRKIIILFSTINSICSLFLLFVVFGILSLICDIYCYVYHFDQYNYGFTMESMMIFSIMFNILTILIPFCLFGCCMIFCIRNKHSYPNNNNSNRFNSRITLNQIWHCFLSGLQLICHTKLQNINKSERYCNMHDLAFISHFWESLDILNIFIVMEPDPIENDKHGHKALKMRKLKQYSPKKTELSIIAKNALPMSQTNKKAKKRNNYYGRKTNSKRRKATKKIETDVASVIERKDRNKSGMSNSSGVSKSMDATESDIELMFEETTPNKDGNRFVTPEYDPTDHKHFGNVNFNKMNVQNGTNRNKTNYKYKKKHLTPVIKNVRLESSTSSASVSKSNINENEFEMEGSKSHSNDTSFELELGDEKSKLKSNSNSKWKTNRKKRKRKTNWKNGNKSTNKKTNAKTNEMNENKNKNDKMDRLMVFKNDELAMERSISLPQDSTELAIETTEKSVKTGKERKRVAPPPPPRTRCKQNSNKVVTNDATLDDENGGEVSFV